MGDVDGVAQVTRIATLASIAEREVGVREEGNNGGARIREYQTTTTLQPGEWPWCAAFVSWCLVQWLATEFEHVKRNDQDTRRAWRCASARAYAWEDWARSNVKCLVLDENAPLQRGDIVTFDFSHIGIVTQPSDNGIVHTVEGNTNADGAREGDGVYAKRRARKLIRRVIRILA